MTLNNKLFLAAILLLGSATCANAQVTGTATATATIVTPISIANSGNMNFGNIAVSSTAGTVTVTPVNGGTRTSTGGVTLPATIGTVASAIFTVQGQANYTYALTLPSTSLPLSSGANTMSISAFTSSAAGPLSAAGSNTIYIGATLAVGAAQAAGTYVSATPFNVTVNYN
jgi:hypothetical protein